MTTPNTEHEARLARDRTYYRDTPGCGWQHPETGQVFSISDLRRTKPKEFDMKFSERNRVRCESPSGFNHALSSWSLSDWMTATLGELGEAANIAKKLNRVRDGIPGNTESEDDLRSKLADEIADTFIYLDLMAQSAGLDLETIVEAKFKRTSEKIGYTEAA